MAMSKFLSMFYEDVPVGLRQMGTEQVHQVLHAGMEMALLSEGLGHASHVQLDVRGWQTVHWISERG